MAPSFQHSTIHKLAEVHCEYDMANRCCYYVPDAYKDCLYRANDSYEAYKNTTQAKFQISIVELILRKAFQGGILILNFAACSGKQRALQYESLFILQMLTPRTDAFINTSATNITALSGRKFARLIFRCSGYYIPLGGVL